MYQLTIQKGQFNDWHFYQTAFVLTLLFNLFLAKAYAQPSFENEKQVEKSLLAEDWAKVAGLLKGVTPETPSPVARLIKGHACLALNRNNESLCLFLSVFLGDSLKTLKNFEDWEKWTQMTELENANSFIVHYLRGDALARLERWHEALNAFNKALEIKPHYALALNARGVVYSAMGEWNNAIVDFDDAIRADSSFADAFASRGSVNIQRRAGADGALRWFNRALKSSPDFALALNGRGCATYARGGWDIARKDFEAVINQTGCLQVSLLNLNALIIAKISYIEKEQAKIAQTNPGMEVNKQIKDLQRELLKTKAAIGLDIFAQTVYGTLKDLNPSFKFGIDLTMKQKMKGPLETTTKLGLGLDIKPNWGGLHDFMKNYTQNDMVDKFSKIQKLEMKRDWLKTQTPGGVRTEDLQRAYVDDGNWIVDTFFGLFYVVQSVKMSRN